MNPASSWRYKQWTKSINSGLNMDNMQQVNSEQRDIPIEDFNGRQELAGSSETSQEN